MGCLCCGCFVAYRKLLDCLLSRLPTRVSPPRVTVQQAGVESVSSHTFALSATNCKKFLIIDKILQNLQITVLYAGGSIRVKLYFFTPSSLGSFILGTGHLA